MINVMKLLGLLKKITATNTLRESSITTTATIITGIFGLIFYILVARNLGPVSFGIFSITIATIILISDISNLGVDTGIIRFVGRYQKENLSLALKFLKLAFQSKLIIWAFILILGWMSIPFLTINILSKPELELPFYLALIGIGSTSLYSFSVHSLQAFQKFSWWALINIGQNGLRLLLSLIFLALGIFTLNNILLIYILIPFTALFLTLLILPKFVLVTGEKEVLNKFFSYNKWVAILTVISAVGSRADLYLITKFLTPFDVGIYSAANQISAVIPQIVFALATVVAPKLASYREKQEVLVYLKKVQIMVIGIALLGLLAIPFAFYFLPLIYGEVYRPSIMPFIILLCAQLLFLISLPSHQAIFYYFSKPKFFFYISVLQLLIVVVLGSLLIPMYGIVGVALAVLVGQVFNFVIPTVWVFKKLI